MQNKKMCGNTCKMHVAAFFNNTNIDARCKGTVNTEHTEFPRNDTACFIYVIAFFVVFDMFKAARAF